VTYRIVVTPLARDMLAAISDRRIKQSIVKQIDALTNEPEQQGKPLVGPLRGYRSARAAGQHYRIIYEERKGEAMVVVLTAGVRKERSKQDIYSLAQRLFRSGLLQTPARRKTKRRK
jgi:mRNA interferase RelE/StbE